MSQSPFAPVSDPSNPVQPSTGVVRPPTVQPLNGTLDPVFWDGLDQKTQGEVAESLPQPPQNDAEWQQQVEDAGATSPDAPKITMLNCGIPVADAADVTWQTDKEGTTEVSYGTTSGSYDTSVPHDGSYVTTHQVHLSGLTPSTTYYVRVASRDADGNIASQTDQFTTQAAGGGLLP